MAKKRSKSEWLEIFKVVHGNRYDYSKLDLDNKDEKGRVCIICPIHGEFWQTLDNHKKGKGCNKCNGGVKLTIEEFVEKAIKLHGNKYDYSKSVYITDETPLEIICPIHGSFWQTPSNHNHKTHPQGCPFCSHRSYKYTNEEFIEKARSVHGNKYGYSKVEYIDNKTDVIITCPIHGDFPQTPSVHFKGGGCPHCQESKLEKRIGAFLNDLEIPNERQKRFEWLGRQSLDFYLPQYNIAIECQGIQHFVESYFSEKHRKDSSLKHRKELDEKKRKLCEEHGVKLLYFSDKKYIDEIITDEKILLEEIKKCNFLNQ